MKSRLHAHVGTLRQLEILLAVYTTGSITAAAAQLHLTQPTVSMQLKKLSEAIQAPIYDTVGRRLIFTQAGHVLADTAREVLEKFALLDMQLADLRGLKAGTLRIAVVTTSKYFIPHLLGPFCQRYPQVEIAFHVGNRQQIIKRLEQAHDDFYVFSHPPEDLNLSSNRLLPNPLVAIAPLSHPLAGRDISLAEFACLPFLAREQGSGTRYAVDSFMREAGVTLNIRMTIESNEAIKHSVAAGLGVSILSAHAIRFSGTDGLVELRVEGLPINTHWHFVWPNGKRLSPLAQTFLEYVQQEGRRTFLLEERT